MEKCQSGYKVIASRLCNYKYELMWHGCGLKKAIYQPLVDRLELSTGEISGKAVHRKDTEEHFTKLAFIKE